MKYRTLLAFSIATGLLSGISGHGIAAPADSSPGASGRPAMRERGLDALTPAERKQLAAARKKAAADPAVAAANQDRRATEKELQSVTKKAMLQKDPSLGPILEKMEHPASAAQPSPAAEQSPAPAEQPPEKKGKHKGAHERGMRPGRAMQALKALTPEERKQFRAAHRAVESTPEVVAAKAKRDAAAKASRDALHAALLKADPTLGPVLDKLEAAAKEGRKGGPDADHEKPRHPGKKGGHGKNAAPEASASPASEEAM